MWGNRLTHTVTHTGKCSERAKNVGQLPDPHRDPHGEMLGKGKR